MKEQEVLLQEQNNYQENLKRHHQQYELAANGTKAKIENLTEDPIPRLAVLGPDGTNTDQAAAEFFGDDYKPEKEVMSIIQTESNSAMIQAVRNGEADMAFVPAESSEGGNVATTYEIAESDLMIIGEKVMPVEHIIVSPGEIKNIKKVRSHSQALKQSSKWLKENLPEAELEEAGSTAGAVKDLSENPDSSIAAVGSRRASEIYDVKKLNDDSIANKDTSTRFWLVARNGETEPTGNDKTTLTFEISDKAGSLITTLESFSKNNINLKKLVSLGGSENGVKFLATIEGHQKDFKTDSAIKGLNGNIENLRLMGSYASAEYETPDKEVAPAINEDMIEKARNDKTARESGDALRLVVTFPDEEGSLLRVLSGVTKQGEINIKHINSIETGEGLDQYGFRIDLDVNLEKIQEVLARVRENCTAYEIL